MKIADILSSWGKSYYVLNWLVEEEKNNSEAKLREMASVH